MRFKLMKSGRLWPMPHEAIDDFGNIVEVSHNALLRAWYFLGVYSALAYIDWI